MRIIFLLAFVGCAFSFTPGNEYRYEYTGRLGMGIPEIRNQVSGYGMQAEIIIQVQKINKLFIQLSNIQVGEYLGDVPCEIHAPMPIYYTPLKGHARELEAPFEVHYLNLQSDVMVVPKTDIEWIINTRKAIALMFVVEPSMVHERSKKSKLDHSLPIAFSSEEPTLFGTCSCDYSFIPIREPRLRLEEESRLQQMKDDVEKDQFPQTFYSMTRSINFDNCTDRVELFRSGLTNISLATQGQFADIMSRASVLNYTLIGDVDDCRIQSGVVQGIVETNPMGGRTDKLMSVSNQTIELISVKKISKNIVLTGPSKVLDTWYMEFASPFEAPTENKAPFVNYYGRDGAAYRPLLPENIATGIDLTDEQIKKFSDRLDEIIKDIADRITTVGTVPTDAINPWNTNEAEIASSLHDASKLARGIDMESLQSLFKAYHDEKSPMGQLKLVLLVEILAASGAGAPMKVLLDNFESGKVSKSRIASIFTTLPNHFTYAPVIPDIMKYVKTLDLVESPFLTTMVYVNFAKTLNRICIDESLSKFTTHYHIFGKERCNSDDVAQDFVDLLSSQFEKSTATWERMVIIEALANLGSHKALPMIKQVLEGQYDIAVKRPAIYALTSNKMERSAEEQVYALLMPIVDNRTIDSYLRQISIITLKTWSPAAWWWQRLAVRSWNETSDNVGAFLYQIIKDLSVSTESRFEKEARIAQFILPMTKPYARSPWYSYTHYYGFSDQKEYLSSDYTHSVIRDHRAPFPLESFHHVWHNIGGIKFLLFETAISADLTPLLKERITEDSVDETSTVRSIPNRRRGNSEIEEVLNQLESNLRRRGMMSQATLLLKAFNNLEFLCPLDTASIMSAFRKDGPQIVRQWAKGVNIHLTKYFDPTSIELIIPTEVGSPFFGRVNSPIIQGAEGKTQLRVKGKREPTLSDILKAKVLSFDFASNYKLAGKVISTFSGLIPWNEKIIVAGVEAFKGISNPGKSTFSIENWDVVRNLTYQFTPTWKKEFPTTCVQTVPFVARKSMWPGQKHQSYEKFSVITLRDDKRGITKKTIPISMANFGVKGHISYEGDVPFPYTKGNFVEYFYKNPALLGKLLTTPSIRLSSSQIVLDYDKSEMDIFHASLAMSTFQNKKQSQMLSANALFEGKNSRYYEISISNDEEEAERAEFSFKVARNAVSKYNIGSKCYTFNLTTKAPVIEDYENLLNDLKSRELEVSYNGALTGGKSCDEQQLATVTGKLNLSEDRKRRLARELKDDCDFDPRNPMVNFRTAAVYDEVTVSVDYTDRIPDYVRNATSHIYDFVRGVSWPHAYFNYVGVNNENNKISAKGSRQLEEGRWDMKIDMPTETAIFDHWRFPYNYDHLISYLGMRPRNAQSQLSSGKLILNSEITNKCVLTKTSVTTFDGVQYRYYPEPCPTVSVSHSEDPNDILLRTDQSVEGKMEAQVGCPNIGMTLTFNNDGLFSINGHHITLNSTMTEILSYRGAYFAEARQVGEFVEVSIPGNFSVKLWVDKIEVEPAMNMRSKYIGMCGNFNKFKFDDLMGPKGCYYTNPVLFTKAWTLYQNVGCFYHHYLSEMAEVKEYQKTCPRD